MRTTSSPLPQRLGEDALMSDNKLPNKQAAPGSIMMYLSTLQDDLMELRESVQLLIEVIDPVLLPSTPREALEEGVKMADSPSISAVASSVSDLSGIVNYLRARVQETKTRVQL